MVTTEGVELNAEQQAVIDVLREELGAVLARAEQLQGLIVYTALTFVQVDEDDWEAWEVSLGSPTVVRPKSRKEVVENGQVLDAA